MGDTIKPEAQAVLDAARKYSEVEIISLDDGTGIESVFSVPEGRTLHSAKRFLDEYAPKPERREGTATAASVASFCALMNRSKDEHSAVFADVIDKTSPKLIGILDYNLSGPKNEDARFRRHRVNYAFPLTTEWRAWSSERKNMAQAEFAEFLEDRILDVMDPAAAGQKAADIASKLGIALAPPQRLMELSRGLKINAETKVANAVTLATGETQFSFEETHKGEDGSPVKVPGAFVVVVRVFEAGDPFQLPIRLRYRVERGQVLWSLIPIDAQKVFDTAVDSVIATVAEATGLPVYAGQPEK
jgi:hypothetical protein